MHMDLASLLSAPSQLAPGGKAEGRQGYGQAKLGTVTVRRRGKQARHWLMRLSLCVSSLTGSKGP